MKKLSILFLSVVALGMSIASCSKSEAAPSIVAKWNFATVQGTYNGQPLKANTKDFFYADTLCTTTPAYYQFDNGGAAHYGIYNSANSCTLSPHDGTYTVASGNKSFTLITSNGNTTFPIISLTATQLKWEETGGSGSTAYDLIHTMNIAK